MLRWQFYFFQEAVENVVTVPKMLSIVCKGAKQVPRKAVKTCGGKKLKVQKGKVVIVLLS